MFLLFVGQAHAYFWEPPKRKSSPPKTIDTSIILKFIQDKLEEELQEKNLAEDWDAKVSGDQDSVALVFLNKITKQQVTVEIAAIDKKGKIVFRDVSSILIDVDDKINIFKQNQETLKKNAEKEILEMIQKNVDDYNKKHETNIAVRSIKVELDQEPDCMKTTVFFWDDSQQQFSFCPQKVAKNKFLSFLRQKIKLDTVRTLDDYKSYYTKDKELNTLLDQIKELDGQLYIKRLSLAEWRLLIRNGQAKLYLETEIEFLTGKSQPKYKFPCMPRFYLNELPT